MTLPRMLFSSASILGLKSINSFKSLKGRSFKIRARHASITKIHERYSDIIRFDLEKEKRKGDGELFAIFNKAGYIEIAIYKSNLQTSGGASSLLGLDYLDSISLEFD